MQGVRDTACARRETLPYGALVLERLIKQMKPRSIVTSVFGIREVLLYSLLSAEERAKDPLIEACQTLALQRSRSIENAIELLGWTDGLFRVPGPVDTTEQNRLRHAACLLSDI